jgi:hypothetical protein
MPVRVQLVLLPSSGSTTLYTVDAAYYCNLPGTGSLYVSAGSVDLDGGVPHGKIVAIDYGPTNTFTWTVTY